MRGDHQSKIMKEHNAKPTVNTFDKPPFWVLTYLLFLLLLPVM